MNISKVIKRKGKTIQEIADKIGIERITLARTIGKNANPKVNTLRKIADALDCNIIDFFEDESTEKSEEDKSSFVCPKCGTKLKINISIDE